MQPLKSHYQVLYVDGAAVKRTDAGWTFWWEEPDVNSMIHHEYTMTGEELLAHGPAGRMRADELDALARELGREPMSLPWCRERRLVEQLVADDLEGVRTHLDMLGDRVASSSEPLCVPADNRGPQPILMLALGVAAWKVSAELIRRGAPLVAPPTWDDWDVESYAIEALDDTDGASEVLQLLLAHGTIEASGRLLRDARAPRIAHGLIDAGADPNAYKPASPRHQPDLVDATPLAVAVVHRDANAFHADRLDVAAVLLERGASIDMRDGQGRTALLLAVLFGDAEPVRWLLERGAAINPAPDAHRRTPRSLAKKRPQDPGSQVILAALEQR